MLMAISFVLIGNTIRLLIYSKRFLIHTMKLVGATPGFIRAPFVRYNVVSGILAAVLAILMLTGALYYLQNELRGFVQILDLPTLILVFVTVLLLGVLLSVVATVFAVNKYLRTGGDKLYYM
jgi:cell division transport system permease protein